MAHQTEIIVNGTVTEVTEFDHTAQEIDDSVDLLPKKMENTLGFASGDILEWAMAQSAAGGFVVNPANVSGLPDSHWCNGFLIFPYSGVRVVVLINNYSGDSYFNQTNSGVWMGWTKNVKAIPPQEYDLPLMDGITYNTSYEGPKYWKDQFGVVTVRALGRVLNNGINNGQAVFTLPDGFRPPYYISGPAAVTRTDGQEQMCGNLIIATNGIGYVYLPENVSYTGFYSFVQFIAN